MLKIQDLSVVRQGRCLLEEVCLELPPGGKAVIVGPSGSGKSSLLAVVSGLLKPGAGSLACDGVPVSAATLRQLRGQMAVIEQEPVLAAESVEEALLLPFSFRANTMPLPGREDLRRVLAEFDLPEAILTQSCAGLSGGEKQRIAVARVMLLKRRIILADEATSALDDASCEAVLRFLLRPELTVLAVSHDRRMIVRFPRVFEVREHRLVETEVKHD